MISPTSNVDPRLGVPPVILYTPHFNLVSLKTRARMTVPGRAQQWWRESGRSSTPWCSPPQDGLLSRYSSLQLSSCCVGVHALLFLFSRSLGSSQRARMSCSFHLFPHCTTPTRRLLTPPRILLGLDSRLGFLSPSHTSLAELHPH